MNKCCPYLELVNATGWYGWCIDIVSKLETKIPMKVRTTEIAHHQMLFEKNLCTKSAKWFFLFIAQFIPGTWPQWNRKIRLPCWPYFHRLRNGFRTGCYPNLIFYNHKIWQSDQKQKWLKPIFMKIFANYGGNVLRYWYTLECGVH